MAVVAFWYRFCEPSLLQLQSLAEAAHKLEKAGVAVVTIPTEPVTQELRAFLDGKGLGVPVFGDTESEVRTALRQYGTPHFFVLDQSGRVRLDGDSKMLESVVRTALVLHRRRQER